MTHREMVNAALNSPDFEGIFDVAITNADIQGYIKDTYHITLTTGEISDIRQVEQETPSRPAWQAWTRPACEMSVEEAAFLNAPYCYPAIDA